MGINRYWAFCGQYYYPSAGMYDDHQSFDTIDCAQGWAKDRMVNGPPLEHPDDYKPELDWGHVWDMLTDTEVGRYLRERNPRTGQLEIVWVSAEEHEAG